MKSTLNRKKIIGIALAVLIAVPILTHNPVYYRLYPGSRIKANVQITVDGEAFPVDQSNFIFRDNRNYQETDNPDHQGKVHVNSNNNADVKIRANQKECYYFNIINTPMNKPITVLYAKANWWDIYRTDIKIDIDTASETATISTKNTEVAQNEIFRSTKKDSETVSYADHECSIGFGP